MSKPNQLHVRLTDTQIDRSSGHMVPAGTLGEVLSFEANPGSRDPNNHCAKIEFSAFKLDHEPLECEPHIFWVPLGQFIFEDPRSPIV